MRDYDTPPRDNQQIADDSEQSDIVNTQDIAAGISNRGPEEEKENQRRVPARGAGKMEEPED
jgi:hypothetical protein